MNLPIYRDLFRLNATLLKDVENIPKIHRYTIGNRIIDSALNSLQSLQRAYDSSTHLERLHEISIMLSELELLSTYLRLANETKIISLKRATHLFDSLDVFEAVTHASLFQQKEDWKQRLEDFFKIEL